RECSVAIVGGVNVIASLHSFQVLTRLGVLAPDGRSKAFDAAADGYGRGEGCVVLVLKRLSDAQTSRDRVRAVISGSAVRHDGRSTSLTAPNPRAQEKVIRTALASAQVNPSEIQYVEAHGTGTLLGDPVEVQGLTAAYGSRENALLIGSVKSHIGHLEAGAGLAGLLKVVLAVQYRSLPASRHYRIPNPHIPWRHIPIAVQSAHSPWPDPQKRLLAGVSSFGMSGTNVHVIVEEAPAEAVTVAPPHEVAPWLLP